MMAQHPADKVLLSILGEPQNRGLKQLRQSRQPHGLSETFLRDLLALRLHLRPSCRICIKRNRGVGKLLRIC